MTNWTLFLDDERYPIEEAFIARSVSEAISLILERGCPEHMSLDHDLGPDQETGMDFVNKFINLSLDKKIRIPDGFTFYIHSQNPVGAKNMQVVLTNYLRFISNEIA